MNKGVWDSFSPAEQAMIEACCHAENNRSYSEFNAKNGDALATLINKHGVQLRKMPDPVMNEIGKQSGLVVREVGDVDAIGKKILDSYLDFRAKAIGWSKLSEQAYFNSRLLPFKY